MFTFVKWKHYPTWRFYQIGDVVYYSSSLVWNTGNATLIKIEGWGQGQNGNLGNGTTDVYAGSGSSYARINSFPVNVGTNYVISASSTFPVGNGAVGADTKFGTVLLAAGGGRTGSIGDVTYIGGGGGLSPSSLGSNYGSGGGCCAGTGSNGIRGQDSYFTAGPVFYSGTGSVGIVTINYAREGDGSGGNGENAIFFPDLNYAARDGSKPGGGGGCGAGAGQASVGRGGCGLIKITILDAINIPTEEAQWFTDYNNWNAATITEQTASSSLYAYNFLSTVGTKSYYEKITYFLPMLGSSTMFYSGSSYSASTTPQLYPLIDRRKASVGSHDQILTLLRYTASFSENKGLIALIDSGSGVFSNAVYVDTGYNSSTAGNSKNDDVDHEKYFGMGFWRSRSPFTSTIPEFRMRSSAKYYNNPLAMLYSIDTTNAQATKFWSTNGGGGSVFTQYSSSAYVQGSGSLQNSSAQVFCANSTTSSVVGTTQTFGGYYYSSSDLTNVIITNNSANQVSQSLNAAIITDGTLTLAEYDDLNNAVFQYLIIPTGKALA